jgi:hypothetical protein
LGPIARAALLQSPQGDGAHERGSPPGGGGL